jgi:hypothetical protein
MAPRRREGERCLRLSGFPQAAAVRCVSGRLVCMLRPADPLQVGKHSAARQQVKAVARRQPAGPQPKLFELPPAFEAAVGRQLAFFQRVLNPAVLLEPLPPALRLSLARNFGFFTKIFTQFIDHQGQKARERGGRLSYERPLTLAVCRRCASPSRDLRRSR